MNIFYKISIDRVNANYISGWCFHRFRPNTPVQLECYQDEQLRATAKASLFREDLKALGVHPTGKCGFEIIADTMDGFDFSRPLLIRPKGKSVVLADLSQEDWFDPEKSLDKNIRRLTKKKLSRTAVFMHIPKTAGTSFNTLAQSIFPKGTAINHVELLPETNYHLLTENYNYISGHLRFGRLRECFSSELTDFYTILREPYAQLESHLKWLIQTAVNPEERYFKATNPVIYNLGAKLSQVVFSEMDSLNEFVDNLDVLEAAFIDNLQTRYFLDQQPERVTPAELETALVNSRRFRLIGFTEKYDSFLRSFGVINQLTFSVPNNRLNISAPTPLFDLQNEEVMNILLPLVKTDLQLYTSIVSGTEE